MRSRRFTSPSSGVAGIQGQGCLEKVPRHGGDGKEGGVPSCTDPSSGPGPLCCFLPAPSRALSGPRIVPGNSGPSCFLPRLGHRSGAGGKEMNETLGKPAKNSVGLHSLTPAEHKSSFPGLPAASPGLPPSVIPNWERSAKPR